MGEVVQKYAESNFVTWGGRVVGPHTCSACFQKNDLAQYVSVQKKCGLVGFGLWVYADPQKHMNIGIKKIEIRAARNLVFFF